MANWAHIERAAYNALLEAGINTLPIPFSALCMALRAQGYEVFSYEAAEDIIIKRTEDALWRFTDLSAFSWIDRKVTKTKYIFFKDTLTASERLFCVLHELGHFKLEHPNIGILAKGDAVDVPTEAQEREADAFAYFFIAPLCVLRATGVSSIDDIAKTSMLEEHRAERIFAKLSRKTDAPDPVERQVLSQFGLLNPVVTSDKSPTMELPQILSTKKETAPDTPELKKDKFMPNGRLNKNRLAQMVIGIIAIIIGIILTTYSAVKINEIYNDTQLPPAGDLPSISSTV